jgi:hypothetical protein
MSDYQDKYPIQSSHGCLSRGGQRSHTPRALDPPLPLLFPSQTQAPPAFLPKIRPLARRTPSTATRMPCPFGEAHLSSLVSVSCAYLTSAHPVLRGADRTRQYAARTSASTVAGNDTRGWTRTPQSREARVQARGKTSGRPTGSAVCAPLILTASTASTR